MPMTRERKSVWTVWTVPLTIVTELDRRNAVLPNLIGCFGVRLAG
jgi:hypothetical protein